jgi:IS5 family transposase
MPQSTWASIVIRKIKPETLAAVYQLLSVTFLENCTISLNKIRIDSTVVKSNIIPPATGSYLMISLGY